MLFFQVSQIYAKIEAKQRYYRPLSNLRHTTVKLAQLRMWVAKDELLPGIIHLECRSGHHISLFTGLQGLTLTF